VLRPISWLSRGVEEVAKGNFDQNVVIWKMDQLGRLTESFNNMTQKIKEMIAARTQLLLDVSHEMRSPLTRIKVALEFLPDNKNKKSIGEDVNELEQMLHEILETERLNSGYQKLDSEKADLLKLIKNIISKFKNMKPGINLIADDNQYPFEGDIERLKICLRNVIDNSIKFSNESSNAVEIQISSEKQQYIIKVQDNGTGIPEEDLPFIFEPFYRVDKSRSKKTGGYGLGLSLSKKIIEAHGGTINIKSKINKGSLVLIQLPVDSKQSAVGSLP
jgi:signal transduction histidine kinase